MTLRVSLTAKGTVGAVQKHLGKDWEVKGAKKSGHVDAVLPLVEQTGKSPFSVPTALKGVGRVETDRVKFDVGFPDTPHTETLIRRAKRELEAIGIENSKHNFFTNGEMDAGNVATILMLLAERANRKVTITDHSLTWYDLKQALGLVDAIRRGDKMAMALGKWADDLHIKSKMAELEAEEAKAAKPKAKAKKAAKPKAKAKAKSKKAAPAKAAKGKKTPTKASLAPSNFDEE